MVVQLWVSGLSNGAKKHAKSKTRHKFCCPVWLKEQKPRQGNNFRKACLGGLLKSFTGYVLELLLVTDTKKIDEIRHKNTSVYFLDCQKKNNSLFGTRLPRNPQRATSSSTQKNKMTHSSPLLFHHKNF